MTKTKKPKRSAFSFGDDITEPVKDTPLGKNANVPPLGPTSFGTSPALKKPSVILPYSIATFAVYNPINWN